MKAVLLITSFIFCLAQCDSRANVTGNKPVGTEAGISPTPKILTGVERDKKKKMDKYTLAKRVEPVEATAAQIIESEDSEIQEIETPFLRDGKIYRVSKFAPTRPIVIYAGIVGDSYTSLIGGNPERYFEFAEKAGPLLDSDDLRKAYILNFLEVTKSQDERFQIINAVTDIKPRPNIDEKQKEEFAGFQKKYESVIKPVKQNEAGIYEAFVIKGQDLIRLDITVEPNGSIKKQETVLESNILIPYAL